MKPLCVWILLLQSVLSATAEDQQFGRWSLVTGVDTMTDRRIVSARNQALGLGGIDQPHLLELLCINGTVATALHTNGTWAAPHPVLIDVTHRIDKAPALMASWYISTNGKRAHALWPAMVGWLRVGSLAKFRVHSELGAVDGQFDLDGTAQALPWVERQCTAPPARVAPKKNAEAKSPSSGPVVPTR